MKLDMTGTISTMAPWAPGTTSTDVEIGFSVRGDIHPTTRIAGYSGRLVIQVSKKEADKLLYGQELRVTVSTVNEA